MMKGVNVTFIVTGLAYFAVSIMGFWAFGTSVADNVLLTFARGPNSWVVAMAGKRLLLIFYYSMIYQCIIHYFVISLIMKFYHLFY